MKNPLREMTRPKALGLAGLAAGALTVSAAAAAVNVGLLSADEKPPFTPTPVGATGTVIDTTTTTAAPVVVYEDVYERASTASAPAPAPVAASPAPAGPRSGDDDTYDDYDDEEREDDELEGEESDDELDD